ncbi:MAG: lysoplasmalogenase [Clostridiales bacterium]|nr:lysoplasmalogenase [Clostridiales bacterium]
MAETVFQVILAVLLVCYVVTAYTFLKVGYPKRSTKSTVLKCTCSLIFLVSAIFSSQLGSGFSTVTVLMLCGFAASLFGDFVLDLLDTQGIPKLNLDVNWKKILLGIVFFFCAHVFYISAFVQVGYNAGLDQAFTTVELIVAAVIFVGYVTLSLLKKMDFGKLMIPAGIYSMTIALMFVKAAYLGYHLLNAPGYGIWAALPLWVGSLMFIASDIILSDMYFYGKFTRQMRIWNHIAYFGGQILLAYSLITIS